MCSLTRVPSAAVALWRRMALVPFSSSASPMAAPQLHADLGRHGNEPSRKVGNLLIGERSGEGFGTLHLLHHRSVVVDAPLLDLVELAPVKDVFDTDLILVLLDKVTQGDSSLEANEASAEVEQQVAVRRLQRRDREARQCERTEPTTDETGRPC